MKKNNKTMKSFLSLMLAFLIVMTSVLSTNVMDAYAASSKNTVKSLTLKIGSSNVTKKTKTMYVGASATIKVTVNPSTAKKNVTFKSSKTSVATVNSKGKVVAKKAGTAKITVKVTGKDKKSKSTYTNIKVQKKTIPTTGVALDKESVKVSVSDTVSLTATVSPANATTPDVTWTSSNTSVATVDSNGIVKGIKAGKAQISVKTVSGNFSAVCDVKVVDSSTENADGVQVTVANSLEKYENTVLTGTDADILVRVVKDEVPVGNTKVTLKLNSQYGNGSGCFEIIGDNVVTTDGDGYASFVVGLKDSYDYNATSGIYESYSVTATAVGSSTPGTTTLSFASISVEDTVVLNNLDYALKNIVPSDNAADSDDGIDSTKSINGSSNVQYVSSQQVSLDKENSVYITAAPYIILPQKAGDTKIGEYLKEVNKSSGEYSVYNDATNEKTTTVVSEVPAGLQYITLHFSNLSISEYSRLDIKTYESEALVSPLTSYSFYHENEDDVNCGVQIPIQTQNTNSVYVVISLISEGQVNDDDNDGYTLDKITGVWKSASANYMTEEELPGTVKWETEDIIYSNPIEMPYDMAIAYVPDVDLNRNYSYSYKVPSFPCTGDAIITVKDANGKLVNYYLFPTENKKVQITNYYTLQGNIRFRNPETNRYEYNTGNIKNENGKWFYYYNENIIKDSNAAIAFKATEAETNNIKSDVSTDGNVVIVNSKVSGHTGLKATLDIDSIKDSELNITNGEVVRTSVQWTPLPELESDDAEEFYTLSTETVDVVATVTDNNGNLQSDREVIFMDEDEQPDGIVVNTTISPTTEPIKEESSVIGTWATVNAKTDEKGQITLKLKADTSLGAVYGLKAVCKGYNVTLSIKGKVFEKANIHWVDPGLYFKEDATQGLDSSRDQSMTAFATKDTVVTLDPRENGNNWIFGLKVVGQLLDRRVDGYAVTNVTGIAVNFEKEKEDTATELTSGASGVDTGIATAFLKSTGISNTKLTGSFSKDSLYTGEIRNTVKISVEDSHGVMTEYEDCGYDIQDQISTSMLLDIPWSVNAINASIVLPEGSTLDDNTSTTAYIRVIDNNSNPVENQKITYTVYKDGEIEQATVTDITDKNGLIKVKLAAPNIACKRVISYAVDGINNGTYAQTISYVNNSDAAFGIAGVTLESIVAGSKAVIDVTFTSGVNANTVKPEMFKVTSASGATYTVESAAISSTTENNIVKLTLNDQSTTAIQNDKDVITVEVIPATILGIEYHVASSDGRIISIDYNGKNEARFKVSSSTEFEVEGQYDSATNSIKLIVKQNGKEITSALNDANGPLIAYASDATVLNDGQGVTLINTIIRTINLTNKADATVHVFYCGVYCPIKITK